MSNRLGVETLVGREYVPNEKAVCIDCKQPFKFGVNVFTRDGQKEVGISGTCEKCFDALFTELEDPEDSYCQCGLEPTITELDRGKCGCCGGRL